MGGLKDKAYIHLCLDMDERRVERGTKQTEQEIMKHLSDLIK